MPSPALRVAWRFRRRCTGWAGRLLFRAPDRIPSCCRGARFQLPDEFCRSVSCHLLDETAELFLEDQRDAVHQQRVIRRSSVGVHNDEVHLKRGLPLGGEFAYGVGRIEAYIAGRFMRARTAVELSLCFRRRIAMTGASDTEAAEHVELADVVIVAARGCFYVGSGGVEEDANVEAAAHPVMHLVQADFRAAMVFQNVFRDSVLADLNFETASWLLTGY